MESCGEDPAFVTRREDSPQRHLQNFAALRAVDPDEARRPGAAGAGCRRDDPGRGVQPLDLDFDADLVGITAITGTALRAYGIADRLRAGGHTVVIGGVHATLLPDE